MNENESAAVSRGQPRSAAIQPRRSLREGGWRVLPLAMAEQLELVG